MQTKRMQTKRIERDARVAKEMPLDNKEGKAIEEKGGLNLFVVVADARLGRCKFACRNQASREKSVGSG